MTLSKARSWGLLRIVLLFSVLTNLLMLTGPLFMLQVYDRVLGSQSEETLVALFGLVGVLYLAYGILEYARGRIVARVGARLQETGQAAVFDASVHAGSKNASARQATQDLDAVGAMSSSTAVLNIMDVPWTPLFIAAIFIFHPILGWAAVAGAGILLVNALLNQLLTRRAQAKARMASGAAQAFGANAIAGREIIAAQGMLPVMRARWIARRNEAVEASMRAADRTGSFTSGGKAFRLFLQSAMLAIGAWLVLQGDLTAGAMIAASILLGRALSPMEQLIGQWDMVQRGWQAWSSLKALAQTQADKPVPTELPRPETGLAAERLSVFRSASDAPILQNVSLTVRPGEVLGIIGPSGSGKSTLVRLLTGISTPSVGTVRLGGATLDQYSATDRGRYIGYLPQDLHFFDGTIAENIAGMALGVDAEAVVAAAKKASIHNFILSLPKGYDTQMRSDMTVLSGGERQRIALARALFGNPAVLILDEPNSALDAEGSDALSRAIGEMRKADGAVIVTTHRPGGIAKADRLIVLQDGKVTASGPKDQILKSMLQNATQLQPTQKKGATA